MSVEMAIKEGFSETRHSTSYGELKKSNEGTSFEVISTCNRFSNVFSGL
ncbi:hypothetical protein [Saccharicrinis fermentans]|nr:hypothetical protein [Saccharicrinis fermentans]